MTGAETHDALRHLMDMGVVSIFFVCVAACVRSFFRMFW